MPSLRPPRLILESLDGRESPAVLILDTTTVMDAVSQTATQPVDSTGNPLPPPPPPPASGTGQTPLPPSGPTST
jgi:hypothetical protein